MEYNIPFTMRDVLPNLYEHWLAKNMVAYMRLAMGGRERKDFLAVMNRPNRYLSREAFYEKEVPFEILYQFYEGKEWMCDRIEKFEHDLKMMKNMAPFAAINYIRYGIGYDEFLKEYAQYRKIKVEELYDLLREIQESAKGYKTFQEWFDSMDAYKEKLKEQSEKVRRQEGIVVSTLHSAKGLEFERVYILDVNEGCMPYQKAVLDPEIEEERRMFYVGMTRAKKRMHLYAVEGRFGKKMEPSRFLVELEEAPKRGNGGRKMGNNANEAHIFWKSPDQQTEVWMKQVSGKTPEEKKEQSRSGYRLLAEMIKTRYAYDLEKETDSVMRTETGKPYLRLHPELFFQYQHSGEWIACALGNVPVGIDIQYHREIKLEQTARKICTPDEWKTFMQAGTEKGKKDFLFQIWTKKRKLSEVYRGWDPQAVVRDFLRGMQLLPVDDAG